MSKKKVLFVVHQLNYGGVQKALISALNALDYDKYDVTLYVRKNRLDLLPDVNDKVTEVIINDDKQHYYRRVYSIWMMVLHKMFSIIGLKDKADKISNKLGEYIAEQKLLYEKKHFFPDDKRYDVVVSYIQGYPAKLVADYINADRKIMFFHGSTDETHALHESIFDRLDSIVGVNEGVQKVLKGLYPVWKDKITYLVNYVDADEVREKSLEYNVDVSKGKTILCSCGRLTPVKGLDLAVKASKILKDAGAQFVWYFVGDGPERRKLEEMIREYGLDDYIVITGMQSNPYPWINACDIYVQPSYEESYGLSIVEAQILYKPVISTATVGGTLLVKNNINGIVCPINENNLADSIICLMQNKEALEMFANNLEKKDYEKDFEKYKEDWNQLLEG